MNTKPKVILVSIIIVVILIFVWIGSSTGIKADLVDITPQSISMKIREEGTVISKSEKLIYAKTGGIIKELNKTTGEDVKSGEVIMIIEDSVLEFAYQQLLQQKRSLKNQKQSAVNSVEQQLIQVRGKINGLYGNGESVNQVEILENELERVQKLYENLEATKEQLEAAQIAVQQARESRNLIDKQRDSLEEQILEEGSVVQNYDDMIASVQSQIDQSRKSLDENVIIAPFDGKIGDLYVDNDMVVPPAFKIGSIVGDGKFEFEVYLLPEDVVYLEEGMSVDLTLGRKDEDIIMNGKVKSISPTATEKMSALGLVEQRVKVVVDIKQGNVKLRDGYSLEAEFEVLKKDNVLAIPKTSVFVYEEQDVVWVVNNGKTEIRKVTQGMKTDTMVVIVEGLNAGDKVVKNPYMDDIGQGVKIIEDSEYE